MTAEERVANIATPYVRNALPLVPYAHPGRLASGTSGHICAEPVTHVAAAIDRYRAGEIDARAVDETIHHYHRAAGELWKFCFSGGGGSRAEFIVGVLDRMAAGAETIDWWERATSRGRR